MTDFFKVSGAGNDFIALVEPPEEPTPEEVRAWCRRGLSVGADGLITLSKADRGVRMRHFNADGGRSDLCLNGTRCAAKLAFFLGWRTLGKALVLVTDAGPVEARLASGGRVGIELPAIVGEAEPRVLEADGVRYDGFCVDVGVPHFVVPWEESLAGAPVAKAGALLRAHADLQPAGANVDFVRFVAPDRWEIRAFERGVEGETLACGTGTVASAVVGARLGKLRLPATALTSGGFELAVEGDFETHRYVLIGDARIVARGKILGGAKQLPSPPRWSS